MRARHVLLAAAAALVAAVAGDFAVRWVYVRDGRYHGNRPPPYGGLDDAAHEHVLRRIEALEEGLDGGVYRAFDAQLGWTNRQGHGGREDRVQFGSLGVRGARAYAPAPPPDTLRVAAFGDSFLHADEVEDEEAWSAVVERTDALVEVLNFGVSAYGTDQALLRMRREGLRGAQVAVLGVLTENAGRNLNRFRPLYVTEERYPSAKPRFLLTDGELELLPQPFEDELDLMRAALAGTAAARCAEHEHWSAESELLPGSALSQVLATRAALRRREPKVVWRTSEEAYPLLLALVEAFVDEAHAAGAQRVLVLVFGTRRDARDRLSSTDPPYWQRLLDDLDARGVPWIDLATDLPRAAGDVGAIFAEIHLNPRGNRMVAASVLSWLREGEG